jgi:1,2-diacylglycerol 3-beta-galactosyltransferase
MYARMQATGVGSTKAVALWPFSSRGLLPSAPSSVKKKKRILIMMSETGGGHKASAEAIQAGFEERFGTERYEVLIRDMWKQYCPFPYNKMPDGYSFLVRHGWLW